MEKVSRAGNPGNVSPAACQGSATKKFARVSLGRSTPQAELLFFGIEEFTPTWSLAWAHASPSWCL